MCCCSSGFHGTRLRRFRPVKAARPTVRRRLPAGRERTRQDESWLSSRRLTDGGIGGRSCADGRPAIRRRASSSRSTRCFAAMTGGGRGRRRAKGSLRWRSWGRITCYIRGRESSQGHKGEQRTQRKNRGSSFVPFVNLCVLCARRASARRGDNLTASERPQRGLRRRR